MTINFSFNMRDHDKDKTSFMISTPGQLGVANVEQWDVQTPATLVNDLLEATRDVVRITIVSSTLSESNEIDGLVYPSDPDAQRHTKLLVTYTDDDQGKVYTVEIPGYNNVGALPNSDDVDLANATIAAWIAAFEAIAGPDGGVRNVVSMKRVGRTL